MPRLTLLLNLLILTGYCLAADSVYIRAPQGPGDAAHAYYHDLLQLALDRTAGEYGKTGVVETLINVSQARSLLLVRDQRELTVDWAGTNPDREEMLRAIPVPLNLGLLEERLLVVRRGREQVLREIDSVGSLRQKLACQGQHWPDSDILEAAQFRVERVITFELMWDMLLWDRCDYFPRSIIEGYVEVAEYGDDRFAIVDNIIISYPFPMFFFVARENVRLARRIETGLTAMLADGSLLAFMQQHRATRSAFPLERYQNSLRIHIDNPALSDTTRTLMQRLNLPQRLYSVAAE